MIQIFDKDVIIADLQWGEAVTRRMQGFMHPATEAEVCTCRSHVKNFRTGCKNGHDAMIPSSGSVSTLLAAFPKRLHIE